MCITLQASSVYTQRPVIFQQLHRRAFVYSNSSIALGFHLLEQLGSTTSTTKLQNNTYFFLFNHLLWSWFLCKIHGVSSRDLLIINLRCLSSVAYLRCLPALLYCSLPTFRLGRSTSAAQIQHCYVLALSPEEHCWDGMYRQKDTQTVSSVILQEFRNIITTVCSHHDFHLFFNLSLFHMLTHSLQ